MGILSEAQKPLIGVTSAEHKRRSAQVRLEEYGVPVVFASPPRFTDEPDLLSPLGVPVKTFRFARHPDVQRQVRDLGLEGPHWFFSMDVNGYLGDGTRPSGKKAELLTTCRGKVESVVKAAQVAEAIYDRRRNGSGHIFFDNLAAPVKLEGDRVYEWRGYIERARLSLSLPLVRLIADMRIWRKVVKASEIYTQVRPFDNAGATAGIDWSIFPLYLPLVSVVTGVRGLRMVWENYNSQKRWVATENGIQRGMLPEMEEHLRAFRANALRAMSNLH